MNTNRHSELDDSDLITVRTDERALQAHEWAWFKARSQRQALLAQRENHREALARVERQLRALDADE